MLTAPMGEAGCICSANKEFFVDFFSYRASPMNGVQIPPPIVLAQHKERESIGKAQIPMRRASLVVRKLAY
jgi:hypothetical protein